MAPVPLRLGVVGLGRAFSLLLPTFLQDPRLRLVAATDPNPAACARFAEQFGGRVHADVAALCTDPEVEAVYIATPHQMHAEHVCCALHHGKHVLVEKPMAITLEACLAMAEAAEAAQRVLIVGPSHSFDGPVLQAWQRIRSGTYGRVRMIHAFNYTDFLYRPRRPEELDTAQGGGVVFSQGAHQIDIVRLLGGGRVRSVRAHTGAWDPARPTEGAYSALLQFEGGIFASITYSGYAHYDSDTLHDGIGEMGQRKAADTYGAARRRLAHRPAPEEEARLKAEGNYGGHAHRLPTPPDAHAHFGHCLVSCDRADLEITPHGVMVHDDARRWLDPLPLPDVPRAEVIDELWGALREGARPCTTGAGLRPPPRSAWPCWHRPGRNAISSWSTRRRPHPHEPGRAVRRTRALAGRRPATRTTPRMKADDDTRVLLKHWHEAVPEDRLAHLVKDATRALVRALQIRLTEHAVSFGHWTFLRILWEQDGVTQRELSAQAGVMEPTTFAAMKAMEALGYVERRRRPDNKKNVYVYLTQAGRALKDKLVPLAEEVNQIAVDGTTARDIATTRKVLLAIIENLARDEARFEALDRRMPSTQHVARLVAEPR